jgi:hypothetical protein
MFVWPILTYLHPWTLAFWFLTSSDQKLLNHIWFLCLSFLLGSPILGVSNIKCIVDCHSSRLLTDEWMKVHEWMNHFKHRINWCWAHNKIEADSTHIKINPSSLSAQSYHESNRLLSCICLLVAFHLRTRKSTNKVSLSSPLKLNLTTACAPVFNCSVRIFSGGA